MSQVLGCTEFSAFIHVYYIALLLLGEKVANHELRRMESEDEGDESRQEENGKQFTDAVT